MPAPPTSRSRAARALPVFLVTFGLLLGACSSASSEADSDPMVIVATTTILGDVATNVAGDSATVEVLTPVGADPHDFQPSAAQVAAVNEADLVVANGLHLEEGLEDVLEAAAADGVDILEIGPFVDPIPFGATGDRHSEDPHVWFDPLRMADAARLVADRLSELDPTTAWASQAEEYADSLTTAHNDIVEILAAVPESNRKLVTGHDSLGYFADRYEFEVIGTVIPAGSTLADPSSDELAGLIETMRDAGVNVVFADTTQPEALADAVAAELGESAEVVDLYTGSLGEPGSDADNLIGMLTVNATRIAAALTP